MAKKVEKQGTKDMNNALNQKEAFFIKYKKAIIAGVIAIIAVVIGLISFKSCKDSRQLEASTAMAKAQELFAKQDYEKALKGDSTGTAGFLKIANDYSNTKAGNLATLYSAICYARLEKWKEAEQYINKFDPKDDVMASPMAIVAKGDIYANLKQPDKAIEAYKKAAEMAEKATKHGHNQSVYPLAMEKAAKVLIQQKKNDEALKIFQDLKSRYLPEFSYQHEYDKWIEYLSK